MIHQTTDPSEQRGSGKTSLIDLAGDLKDEFVHLLRTTTQLLRIELAENVNNASTALRRTLIGFVVAGASAFMLLLGIDLAIIYFLAPEVMSYPAAAAVSTLGLAVLLGIVGGVLVAKNKKALKPEDLIPDRTLATLEDHAEWISRKAGDIKNDTRKF